MKKRKENETVKVSNDLNMNMDHFVRQRPSNLGECMVETEETKSKHNVDTEYMCKNYEIIQSLQIIDIEETCMKHREGFTGTLTVDEFKIKILGDGNCFFRSISQALTDSESSHEFMRCSKTKHMASI